MILGVPKERAEGERRVALVPDDIHRLSGIDIVIESGAGGEAGFSDSDYLEKGARLTSEMASLYQSDIIIKVQTPSEEEVEAMKEGSLLISFLYPLMNLKVVKKLSQRRVTAFAMDLIPRISRAQSMDALSSQSTVYGYRAVVLAAENLPRFFPLLMTAAGTVPPARVLVIGAGVAGLQAIATARRLGAIVEAYDVRPQVRQEIESLGAKFIEMPIVIEDAQDSSGYAKVQSEDFYLRQQKFLAERCSLADVVISTALVPGQRAPVLISEEAVRGMRRGSVIVDLAAEQGGNCILTEKGRTTVKHGVTIIGPVNLASSMAPQASQLYSRNVTNYLLTLIRRGSLLLDLKDELISAPLVVHQGEVRHPQTRSALEGGAE
jgi:NAD(P) transhydrogenase subunit alpha